MTESAVSKIPTPETFQAWLEQKTTAAIAALPLTVPDGELKRARARLRVALSEDSQGRLRECTADSVAKAIVLSALSGLFPGGPSPDVWLIPRKNRHKGGVEECNWQMSFRGYIRLARRVGWDLEPVLVFKEDFFEYEEGMEPRVVHRPKLDAPQTWETLRFGYVRVFPQDRRYTKLAVLSKERILQRRARAQDDGIWKQWPLEKTLATLCNFAGAREMFPCDDPTRYAIAADVEAEVGADLELPTRRSVTPGATLTSLRELTGGGETIEVTLPAREMEPAEDGSDAGDDAPPPLVEEQPADEAEVAEGGPPPEAAGEPVLDDSAIARVVAQLEARGYTRDHFEAASGMRLESTPAYREHDVLKRVQQLPDLTKRKGR